MGIDQAALTSLFARARREVDSGLLPSVQVAVGYEGELVGFETFGEATNETRYAVFSATKPFVAATVWTLIADGSLDTGARVADYIDEFATNGRDVITVEQVLLHTSGFPTAPLNPIEGDTSAGRRAAFARWRLNWEPGTKFEYHPTAAHWVLAELIETLTGTDFRDVTEQRVTGPIGLGRVLGDVPHRAATLEVRGEEATPEELLAAFGVSTYDRGEVTFDALLALNEPAAQRVGLPGGGGVMRAADLAVFYQRLLHDDGRLWPRDLLAEVTGHVRNRFPDPMTGVSANRTLGLVVAGDDGLSNYRGMGRTVSPRAFGHNGAGGQVAFADPATGLSFGYCTNGLDQNVVREARRTTAVASLAGLCAPGTTTTS